MLLSHRFMMSRKIELVYFNGCTRILVDPEFLRNIGNTTCKVITAKLQFTHQKN